MESFRKNNIPTKTPDLIQCLKNVEGQKKHQLSITFKDMNQ